VKLFGINFMLTVLLAGCSAAPTLETLGDVYSPQEQIVQREVLLSLPSEAAVQVISGERGTLYLCDGYEITRQTLLSGNLSATLRELTGYEKDKLTIIETGLTDATRYECVWTAAGEDGDVVGRAAVLDDGCHHYCLTVMADADDAGQLQKTWQEIFASYGLD